MTYRAYVEIAPWSCDLGWSHEHERAPLYSPVRKSAAMPTSCGKVMTHGLRPLLMAQLRLGKFLCCDLGVGMEVAGCRDGR